MVQPVFCIVDTGSYACFNELFRSSNLKPIITVPKVNLAIRTASSCSRSSSGPPSPRWSTSCWLGPAAPLLRAAPFAFLRCGFCLEFWIIIQFCFVLLGLFDIRSLRLRTQLPSAHSPTWCFLWVTMETLGLVRKRWEAAADSNLRWRDTSFLLWCQISTRYLFKPCIGEKTTPFDWRVKWGKFLFIWVQLSMFLAWLPWILQKTVFSLVKSRLALGSPSFSFVWLSPYRKWPYTQENGCWLPHSDHIHRWYPFPDQTKPGMRNKWSIKRTSADLSRSYLLMAVKLGQEVPIS